MQATLISSKTIQIKGTTFTERVALSPLIHQNLLGTFALVSLLCASIQVLIQLYVANAWAKLWNQIRTLTNNKRFKLKVNQKANNQKNRRIIKA